MDLVEKIRAYLRIANDGARLADIRNSIGYPGILVMDNLKKMGNEVRLEGDRWYWVNPESPPVTEPVAVEEPTLNTDDVVAVAQEITDPVAAVAVLDPPVIEPPALTKKPKNSFAVHEESPWVLFLRWLRSQDETCRYTIQTATAKNWRNTKHALTRDTIRAIAQVRKWGSPEDVALMETLIPESASKPMPMPVLSKKSLKSSIKDAVTAANSVVSPLETELTDLRTRCCAKPGPDPEIAQRWRSICSGINAVLGEIGFSEDSHLRSGLREIDQHFAQSL